MKGMPWNCLLQMVWKDLIISALQSVERLLLLSACSEPALLLVSKANFRWCHPIQQKMLVDYMGWAQSSLWLPSKSLSYCVLKQKSPHVQACSLDLSYPSEKFEKSARAFIERVSHVHLHQPRKGGEEGRQRRQRNKRMLMKIEWEKKHCSVSNISPFNL